jgi:long-chain acyl-CoA synthetase
VSDVFLLTRHFYESAERYSSKAALMEKQNGVYHSITYQEMKERVEQTAAWLLSLGYEKQTRVALLSENRPEWPIADMGIISAGMVNVPIYPTLTAHQIEYILNDSGSRAIFVSKPAQLQKIISIYSQCPELKYVVIFDPPDVMPESTGLEIISMRDVLNQGASLLAHQQGRNSLSTALKAAQESDMVSIVYTSGTTGNPKGVMLTHRNFASNARAALTALGFDHTQTSLSFLPLSHVLERVVNYVMQYCGATIAYAESIDTIGQNLQEVKPSAFVAVPRVFEKIYNRIIQGVANEKPLKKKIFNWALAVGKEAAVYTSRGKAIPGALAIKHRIADKLVFGKIRAKTGGNLKFAVSGGAPLMRELAEFFFAIGINIYEGYGLTETSPVICCNRPGGVKFGYVGQTIEDVEVKIAPDGEILARGPNIMAGYFNNPEATREVINAEGWFHTGDIGELDSEGFLKITDRKKEIIVMSNGKNVAPQPIENTLKTSPYIEQAIMLGNNQKYMAALIYPNQEMLEKYAGEHQIRFGSRQELFQHPETYAFLEKEIHRMMVDFARYEQVKKFTIIEEELTQENGFLTPTLKYKRRVINEHFQPVIDQLFAETGRD